MFSTPLSNWLQKNLLQRFVQMGLSKQSGHNLLLALAQGANSLVPAIYQSTTLLFPASNTPNKSKMLGQRNLEMEIHKVNCRMLHDCCMIKH